MKLAFLILFLFGTSAMAIEIKPSIEELQKRQFLDDYYSNVVFGYKVVTETPKYAKRYVGNSLKCSSCHLNAGTTKDAIPLYVAGIYPKWRDKNGRRNGIGLRIRECFVYSHNGIMPSENAPEVLAVAAYISYLSQGQVIGQRPEGQGVPSLPSTGFDPNPANGKTVYNEKCASCHQANGAGLPPAIPALWGFDSYNKGAGMNNVRKAAGYIWANMPLGMGKSLTHQEAFDVAAYLNIQIRPADPRKGRFVKLFEKIANIGGVFSSSEGN